ncbi:MAG TPA: hypothetical protein VNM22_14505 [Candidatus Limnocylindrales bacterium]|nr:hypothetical protein [Candidatus Limnocylindrales bacterium]
MKVSAGLVVSFLILLWVNNPVSARIYKWYDRNGVVHVANKFPDQAHEKDGVFSLEEVDVSEPSGVVSSASLSILNAQAYWSDGRVTVVGEVQNNTSSQLVDLRLQVVGYDSSNKLFNMTWVTPDPSVLDVGKSGVFKTYLEDPYQSVNRVEIRWVDAENVQRTLSTVYVTKPGTESSTTSQNVYTPRQEAPVTGAPYSSVPSSPTPYYGTTGGYGSMMYGFVPYLPPVYVPYSYVYPGTVIYNKKIFICHRCGIPPKLPFRFDPPVRFNPRAMPQSPVIPIQEGKAKGGSDVYRRNR